MAEACSSLAIVSQVYSSRLTAKTYNKLTLVHRKNATHTAVVVGDSYADDHDMGFETWPHLLTQTVLNQTALITATGGTTSDQAVTQLERAHAHLEAVPGALIVHTGGNDLLQSLWWPHMVLLLAFDVALLIVTRLSLTRPLERPPLFSFAGVISRRLSSNLIKLLDASVQLGHKSMIVSHLPLCPAIPLARTLLRILTFGLASDDLLTELLLEYANLFRSEIDAALNGFLSKRPNINLIVFDEGYHLHDLATAMGADRFGAMDIVYVKVRRESHASGFLSGACWLASKFARILGGGRGVTEKSANFWRDLHHPSQNVHFEMCKRVGQQWQAHAVKVDSN